MEATRPWVLQCNQAGRHSLGSSYHLASLQVAEYLYDVLANRTVSSRQMPVLLLANKSDCGAKAHSVEFIRKRLEKALDQLRTTRAEVETESGNVRVLLITCFCLPSVTQWSIRLVVCTPYA